MKRLLVVYNPRSSRFREVEVEVLAKVRELKGFLVGKYEVDDTNVEDNARKLARIIRDGDLVLAVGGDGTVSIAANAIMAFRDGEEGMIGEVKNVREKVGRETKNARRRRVDDEAKGIGGEVDSEAKDTGGGRVSLGVLPYGNFNDTAKTLGTRRLEDVLNGREVEIWPLETLVDGQHFRYAVSYFTLGLFAEACAVFDEEKMRKSLREKRRSPIFSWLNLGKWYFENRFRRVFLPEMKMNGRLVDKKVTDVVVVNGKKMAGLMRSCGYMEEREKFLVARRGMRSFFRLMGLMARSIFYRIPGEIMENCVLEFLEPASFEIQAEGEYKRFAEVRKVEIRKAKNSLRVVVQNKNKEV